jgi:signal transduction histidine kinase
MMVQVDQQSEDEAPLRVLVVDDDPILCEFARVYLGTPTTLIEAVGSGEDGWAALQTEPFDIALIDIEMPGMDGYALVERIRADSRLGQLPVIMVTGREDAASIDQAYDVGATSFVVKPVNWRQLTHQLRYVVRASRSEQAARAACARATDLAASRSAMLSILAHEFRTPMHQILGFAQLLSASPLSADVQADCARQIAAAGGTLATLFTDVKILSDLGTPGGEALREDVFGLSAVLAASAGRKPAVLPSVDVLCDRDLISRALTHLIRNGEIHGGGEVTLDVRHAPGGDLLIHVCDRGQGIDPTIAARAHEGFVQADATLTRQGGGLGLGLAIAHRVARAHGGSLLLEAREGGGTVAILRLPASRVIGAQAEIAA